MLDKLKALSTPQKLGFIALVFLVFSLPAFIEIIGWEWGETVALSIWLGLVGAVLATLLLLGDKKRATRTDEKRHQGAFNPAHPAPWEISRGWIDKLIKCERVSGCKKPLASKKSAFHLSTSTPTQTFSSRETMTNIVAKDRHR